MAATSIRSTNLFEMFTNGSKRPHSHIRYPYRVEATIPSPTFPMFNHLHFTIQTPLRALCTSLPKTMMRFHNWVFHINTGRIAEPESAG